MRDAGIYCRPCAVNGLFKFTSGADGDVDDELVVGHFTVAVADDAVLCAGCGKVLNP